MFVVEERSKMGSHNGHILLLLLVELLPSGSFIVILFGFTFWSFLHLGISLTECHAVFGANGMLVTYKARCECHLDFDIVTTASLTLLLALHRSF